MRFGRRFPPSAHIWRIGLSEEERGWLISTLETERRLVEAKRKVSLWESFWNPKVLWLTLNYFGIVTASVGMLLFLPQIIKQLGLTNMQVGWVTMIPYLCAVVAMLAWGWVSDRLSERRWTLSLACLISAAGLFIAAQNLGTVWALVGMSIAAMGFYGSKGPFWAIPSMILTGTAAASGIAWINSVGNLGGFFGPTMVGWAKDYTGSFAGGLYALAGFALMSAVISALWLPIPNPGAARPGERTGGMKRAPEIARSRSGHPGNTGTLWWLVAWSANAPDIALRKAPSAPRLRAGLDFISVPSVALTARRNARNQSGLIFQSGGNEFSIGLRATAIVSDRW